jgi:hypothetical protein
MTAAPGSEPQQASAAGTADDSQTPLDPSHSGHPDHRLYRQSVAAVRRLDASMGRTPDDASARMVARLVLLAKQNELERIDHVALSVETDDLDQAENVFIVQGAMNDPAHTRAFIKTERVVDTPVAETFRMIELFNAQQE